MITVKTAMTFDRARESRPNRTSEVKEEDQTLLEYLDATIESGMFKSFNGQMFEMKIPVTFASPEVVAALKSRYESGGWIVGVFLVREDILKDTGKIIACQMVFSAGGTLPTQESIEKPQEKRPRVVPDKPRVVLVSDVPGWAFDQNMKDLAWYLRDKFQFSFFYTENWFKGERPDWDEFDVIYEAYHRNPQMGIPMERALGALRSEWWHPEKPSPPGEAEITRVNEYRGFQVACERNFNEFKPRCPGVVYLTNPVNTQRFEQTPLRDKIIASWNGNAKHKSPDGRYIKHFYDISLPACIKAKIDLIAAEYGTKEGPLRRRSFEEMPAFYQQANVALCASEYESASNSVMEAMASGLALIATDVGNHRELRDTQLRYFGDSGILLVERSVPDFVNALRELTPKRAAEMGAINRAEIKERWSWDAWASKYENFLRMGL